MRPRWLVAGLATAVTVGAVVLAVRSTDKIPFARSETCGATVDGTFVELDPEQAKFASLIAATATRRGMPARATTIGIATAYQESKIRNIDYGDRDSVGLFQQRPSQGWGTAAQIMNPRYSIGKFFDGLQKVDGYTELEVTEAAQAVQRSAFATAYADHEEDARVLASALSGNSPAAFSCQVRSPESDGAPEGADGLTPRAAEVLAFVEKAFGEQSTGGYAPGGVDTGHIEGSAHYEGRAVDFFFRPVDADSLRSGWALAQYVVANARQLGVRTVIYDARIWTARRSDEGWRDYRVPDRAGDPDVLAHRDHVHVDVA
ncbi:hypothetical protein [Solicola sp. PLA-1-18]|uniref:hypothetical protein n=1 Tax=Solicola sp. PLA-1-18 TaxID=3380532 RepID=UPI003B803843